MFASTVAKRQAETEVTFKAYDVTRKDGTTRRVRERSRTSTGASNAEINRELTILKRMFSLAFQAGKLLHKPHIPLLREDNVRTGFFEPDQFASVYEHLPTSYSVHAIEFAYITGWRIPSEVLTLQWRHVDFKAGEVRLDPGSTKNRDGRVFPFTDDLRRLLEDQHAEHVKLRKAGTVEPWVFFRMVADKRGGEKHPRPIRAFAKAWKARLHRCRVSRPHSTRPAPNRRQEHGAPRSPRTRRDASSADTRRDRCSSATTSSRTATSARLLRSFKG